MSAVRVFWKHCGKRVSYAISEESNPGTDCTDEMSDLSLHTLLPKIFNFAKNQLLRASKWILLDGLYWVFY